MTNAKHLANVLINYVCSFLTFGEIFAFRLTCAEINDKISTKYKDFNIVIKSRLKEFFGQTINIEEFCNILYESECKIYGSFIFQCITGMRWRESDVDIFCKMQLDPGVKKFHVYMNENFNFYVLVPSISRSTYIIYKTKDENNKKINVTTPTRYVKSIFAYIDIEMTYEYSKCIYNGKKLYVKNWKSIWLQTERG